MLQKMLKLKNKNKTNLILTLITQANKYIHTSNQKGINGTTHNNLTYRSRSFRR